MGFVFERSASATGTVAGLMMEPDIDRISAPFIGLTNNLKPQARRVLAREIARNLRDSQGKRIAAQKNPDGTAYEPRKSQARSRKGATRRRMFSKIRTARYLKMTSTASIASVGFTGNTERIARVHQFGLRDRVNAKRGLIVKYAKRGLLGFTEEDHSMVAASVINHLGR